MRLIFSLRYLLAFLLITPSLSHAGGWSGSSVISSVGVSAGYIIVPGDHDPGNPDFCEKGLPLVVDNERADYSEIYALLVASFLQGKQVDIYVQGCIDYSGKTRPRITAVTAMN